MLLANDKQKLSRSRGDEWYTPEDKALEELEQWAKLGKFKGKRIICPCDLDTNADSLIYMITWYFDKDEIYFSTNTDKVDYQWKSNKEHINSFLKGKKKMNIVKVLLDHAEEWGIASVTASGYDPETKLGLKFQDVNYENFDICITNPPFNLIKEFLNYVDKIDFLIMTNRNNYCII